MRIDRLSHIRIILILTHMSLLVRELVRRRTRGWEFLEPLVLGLSLCSWTRGDAGHTVQTVHLLVVIVVVLVGKLGLLIVHHGYRSVEIWSGKCAELLLIWKAIHAVHSVHSIEVGRHEVRHLHHARIHHARHWHKWHAWHSWHRQRHLHARHHRKVHVLHVLHHT